MQQCFKEYLQKLSPIKGHKKDCDFEFTSDNVTIFGSTARGEKYLLTLEALFQYEIKPSLNTKEEYKSRTLTLKF